MVSSSQIVLFRLLKRTNEILRGAEMPELPSCLQCPYSEIVSGIVRRELERPLERNAKRRQIFYPIG